MLVFELGIDFNWIFYVGVIVIIFCFLLVFFFIMWVKVIFKGFIMGKI